MSQTKNIGQKDLDFLKSFFSKVSFEQKTSYKSITKYHFDKWRNYTLNQMKLKMMHNVALLEEKQKVEQAKSKILQKAYSSFGTILVIGFFLFVLYYNYLMFERYLVPLMLGLIVALPLGIIRDIMRMYVEKLERFFNLRYRVYLATFIFITVPIFTIVIGFLVIYHFPNQIGFVTVPLFLINVAAFSVVWRSQRDFIITIGLIIVVVVIFLFPIFFLVKNCLHESVIATDAIVTYISNNEEFNQLLQDYKNSSIYKTVTNYAETWGWDTSSWTLDALNEYLKDFVEIIGKNINVFFGSTYSVVTNISDLIVSLFIFSSCLFYCVLYKDDIWTEIEEISPFTPDDNQKLFESLKTSISRIFVCSFFIGFTHFWSTFLSFHFTGLELKYIFSAISAFLSIVPLLSSWIIWVPAALLLFSRSQIIGAAVLASVHLFTNYVIDGYVLSYVPGNPYLIGMSVFLGVSTFGISGMITGPLLAGLVVTLLNIYKSNYRNNTENNPIIIKPHENILAATRHKKIKSSLN